MRHDCNMSAEIDGCKKRIASQKLKKKIIKD